MAEVRARTPNAEFSDNAPQGRVFGVVLTREEQRFAGQLQIRQDPGNASTRSFEGDTCAEVVSALALLTALAIDPNASGAATIEVPPTPPPVKPPIPIERPPAPKQPPAAVPPQPAAQPRALWHGAAGGRLSVAGWVAPSLLPGFDLFAETWQERPGPLSPGFRLGLGMAWNDGQAARWRWYAARLEACPLRAPVGWKLVSQTCVGADVGAVHGQGVTIDAPRSSTQLWAAATLGTGVVLESGSFFAGVHGGIVVPITRYHFYFDHPRIDLHQVPYVGATLAASIGARFF